MIISYEVYENSNFPSLQVQLLTLIPRDIGNLAANILLK